MPRTFIVSRRLIQPLILQALREDIGAGDVTSKSVIPSTRRIRARIITKAPGIVAGAQIAGWVFEAADRRIRWAVVRADGKPVRRGDAILRLEGPARSILAAERTALNFLGHLSGIATLTHRFVERVHGTQARILDTRKTLPGLRALEKDAVRAGGGHNHRRGLDDAVLIKTNHLRAVSRGSSRTQAIRDAVRQAQRRARGKFIEIEVTNLAEVRAALAARPDAILLDNWPLSRLRQAVKLRTCARPLLEVSGGVTLQNVRAIARVGVDRISVGRLTPPAQPLDVSLKLV